MDDNMSVAVKSKDNMLKWRLRVLMAERELSNQKLAEMIGYHPGTISKLMKLPSRIDTHTLNLLCEALNCQPGDLIHYEPDNIN